MLYARLSRRADELALVSPRAALPRRRTAVKSPFSCSGVVFAGTTWNLGSSGTALSDSSPRSRDPPNVDLLKRSLQPGKRRLGRLVLALNLLQRQDGIRAADESCTAPRAAGRPVFGSLTCMRYICVFALSLRCAFLMLGFLSTVWPCSVMSKSQPSFSRRESSTGHRGQAAFHLDLLAVALARESSTVSNLSPVKRACARA